MNLGEAIEVLKNKGTVARSGWNGKGIFIELQTPDENSKMTSPYIFIDTRGLKTDNPDAPKSRVPWLASQTDMLAEDWDIVREPYFNVVDVSSMMKIYNEEIPKRISFLIKRVENELIREATNLNRRIKIWVETGDIQRAISNEFEGRGFKVRCEFEENVPGSSGLISMIISW